MDKFLESYLNKLKIKFEIYKHPAVFTVKQSTRLKINIPGLHTKNLFLKDESNNFYLVSMRAEKRLDLKSLKEKINAKKKLSFASSQELKEKLSLTPGSVSIFGMIYAAIDVTLIVDKKVWEAEKSGFHPNINTETIILDHNNLEKFYNSLNSKKLILSLD